MCCRRRPYSHRIRWLGTENILYGMPGNTTVTDMDIESAARLANAHDFIMSFEKKYDTLVGEAGVALSGGQKQVSRTHDGSLTATDQPVTHSGLPSPEHWSGSRASCCLMRRRGTTNTRHVVRGASC